MYIYKYIIIYTLHYITLHCIALHYITLHYYTYTHIYTHIHIHDTVAVDSHGKKGERDEPLEGSM